MLYTTIDEHGNRPGITFDNLDDAIEYAKDWDADVFLLDDEGEASDCAWINPAVVY